MPSGGARLAVSRKPSMVPERLNRRSLALGALQGLLLGALVVFGVEILDADALIERSWPTLKLASPALVLLVLLLAVRASVAPWRQLRLWSLRRFEPADAFLLSVTLALAAAPRWVVLLSDQRPLSGRFFVIALAVTAGAIELARWSGSALHRLKGRGAAPAPADEPNVLERVLGDGGMEPLADLDSDDPLDRRPFVDTLEAAIRHPRQHSLTFGLSGPWGSGKTTILNALDRRRKANDVLVVRFDAMSFREPERVVANYLAQLAAALRAAGASAGFGSKLRRLGLGMAPLAGGRVAALARNWLSTDGRDFVPDLLADLRSALSTLPQTVAVIVDDLDRLERDELHAALRTLRLMGDLPRVVHVLAYDRRQLARSLFPHDESGDTGRDYLAKIVQVEVSLSTPTPEAASRILSIALGPLLGAVDKSSSDAFVERLNSVPRQVFVEAMPTPRDVRRVAAATALLWPRLERDINLFDLFVLQLIHARFPRVFDAVHAHPEWFTELAWSGDLWRISEGDRWKAEREKYMGALREREDPGSVNSARLLELVFPSVRASTGGRQKPSERFSRRDRRICHPDVFPRYFQLSVPRELIAESSIEDLAAQVVAAAHEVRPAVVLKAVDDAARGGRADALFDQWDLFLDRLSPKGKALPYGIARDVVVGVADAVSSLEERPNDPLSTRGRAVWAILRVISRVETTGEITGLLRTAIRACQSFDASASLLLAATASDRDDRAFPERALDEHAIQAEFDAVVRERLSRDPGSLFDLSDSDVAAVLYRTHEITVLRDVVVRALGSRKQELPRLLALVIELAPNPTDPEQPRVVRNDLASLHIRLDLDNVFRATEQLPTDYWDDAGERALVAYFRSHWKAIAEPAR